MIINDYKIDYPPYCLQNNEPVRIIIDQDGEKLLSLNTHIGFTHKGVEKSLENCSYKDGVFFFKHLNQFDNISNTYTYILLLEEAMELDTPVKTQILRIILLELARIANHFNSLMEIASLLSVEDMVKTSCKIIKKIYNFLDTGNENSMYITSVNSKFKDNFIPELSLFLKDELNVATNNIAKIFSKNSLFKKRLEGIGVIGKEDALLRGLNGINLRASGVTYDTRVNNPYGGYEMFKIFVPTCRCGDCFSRYKLRLEEIFSSIILINDAITKMPLGDYIYKNQKIVSIVDNLVEFNANISLKKGFYQKSTETPKGEFTINLFAGDYDTPKRVKITSPSSNALFALEKLCLNHFISDVPIVLNSLDISFSEVDR